MMNDEKRTLLSEEFFLFTLFEKQFYMASI